MRFGRGFGSDPCPKAKRAVDVASDEGGAQRCAERVHGAKDEDDAPWTNLFTVHGLAPNHPVGRRTRKAGAPFLCLKSRTAPVPEGTGGPQIFFFASNKRFELHAARSLKPSRKTLNSKVTSCLHELL